MGGSSFVAFLYLLVLWVTWRLTRDAPTLCSCRIPLPPWVTEEMQRNPDIAYTDKAGRRNHEYVSLGCDTLPVLKGRTPIQVYADFMRSFRDTFEDLLGDVIVVCP